MRIMPLIDPSVTSSAHASARASLPDCIHILRLCLNWEMLETVFDEVSVMASSQFHGELRNIVRSTYHQKEPQTSGIWQPSVIPQTITMLFQCHSDTVEIFLADLAQWAGVVRVTYGTHFWVNRSVDKNRRKGVGDTLADCWRFKRVHGTDMTGSRFCRLRVFIIQDAEKSCSSERVYQISSARVYVNQSPPRALDEGGTGVNAPKGKGAVLDLLSHHPTREVFPRARKLMPRFRLKRTRPHAPPRANQCAPSTGTVSALRLTKQNVKSRVYLYALSMNALVCFYLRLTGLPHRLNGSPAAAWISFFCVFGGRRQVLLSANSLRQPPQT
ncbi:hypothetical protein EXN66_Car008932 [Channa argus]|uniref:Uncharacterized protein n=1 Tax=Channa argus TaxID=215402 RepID=A0A6G1PTD7_CHAAH|nr:hypothetical protein EXN66_Car008932 [Channa argus]